MFFKLVALKKDMFAFVFEVMCLYVCVLCEGMPLVCAFLQRSEEHGRASGVGVICVCEPV